MVQTLKSILVFLAWVAGFLLVVAAVLKALFIDVVIVGHNAMAPTLIAGEQVLLWRNASPQFGKITLCEHPSRPNELVVGRVVGREGARIEAPDGYLTISGQRPDVHWQGQVSFSNSDDGRTDTMRMGLESIGRIDHPIFVRETGFTMHVLETVVEPGRLYLLSDNRSYVGHDSRAFGTVRAETCRGRVFMRFRPVNDNGAGLTHRPLEFIN